MVKTRNSRPLRVVVLISGTGSILNAILQATGDATYPVEVVAVGADRNAPGLSYAEKFGVHTFIKKFQDYDNRESWGEALLEEISQHDADLVLLAGLMRILPKNVVHALTPNLINTHPSLLPKYPGAKAVRDALADGASQTGVSIFIVDEGVDTGEVLIQETVEILSDDSEETLHERIKVVERLKLVELLKDLATGQRTLDNVGKVS